MMRSLILLMIVVAVVACGDPASAGPSQSPRQAPDTAETLCVAVRALQVLDEEHASRLAAMLGDWPAEGPDATIPASEKAEALAHVKAMAEGVQLHQTPLDVLTSPVFPDLLADARVGYSSYMIAAMTLEPWLDDRSSDDPGHPFDTGLGQLRAGREALGRAVAGIDQAVAAGRMTCPA